MGHVYRARDTRLDRDVAIKTLPDGFETHPERLARFDREAKTLAALNHPNIAQIHGVEEPGPSAGPGQSMHAIVMELVKGETLSDCLARGRMALCDVLAIAGQLADALDAAHEKGIIHRDLKPTNVMVTPDGVVKVLDFGLAKAVSGDAASAELSQSPTVTVHGTREGVVVGTAAYMSPEQARGLTVDKRTDIWAFGCVLYEMLANRPLFAGATTSDVIAAILGREPEWTALPGSVPVTRSTRGDVVASRV